MKPFKELPAKQCEDCHKEIVRKRRPDGRWESPQRHLEKKYCSKECSINAVLKKNFSEAKECESCKKTFYRKRGEKPPRFKLRLWCSKKCYYTLRGMKYRPMKNRIVKFN